MVYVLLRVNTLKYHLKDGYTIEMLDNYLSSIPHLRKVVLESTRVEDCDVLNRFVAVGDKVVHRTSAEAQELAQRIISGSTRAEAHPAVSPMWLNGNRWLWFQQWW